MRTADKTRRPRLPPGRPRVLSDEVDGFEREVEGRTVQEGCARGGMEVQETYGMVLDSGILLRRHGTVAPPGFVVPTARIGEGGPAVNIFDYMDEYEYEQLAMYTDKQSGLRAMICIHDTTLGPACGGTRMWPFATEQEAIVDVLRLARAMTYKSALAGLDLGGGKALIIGDPRTDKTEALFRAHGRFVNTLGGRFLTTEDVGTLVEDMVHVRKETPYAAGLPEFMGGLGGAEVITGYGLYRGAQACCGEVFGSDSLEGRTVAIQGFGKVAHSFARYLVEDGATSSPLTSTRAASHWRPRWAPPSSSRRTSTTWSATSSPRAPSAACSTATPYPASGRP